MGIAPSPEQYQTLLVESGLLSRDEVRQFLKELSSKSTPTDAQALAKALVKAEKLTKFQATAVYQGQIKELVLGEYEVLDKLGQGGMGVVLLARHRRMERLAAVKVLPKSTMKSPTAIDRFYREAKAAARLSHPNIVSAYDASEKDGTHYLVMEFVDGEDLAQVSKQRGALPVEQAVDCMIQAARGLQYAHDQGVVHRDIKPANLLVDRNGTVKILDMGLARLHSLADAEPTEQDRLTQSGQVMGTCDYMAPEQAEDTHGADHRADIYALGCTLYRLLTGDAPYKGDSLIKILMAHRDDAIPSLRDQRPDVSEELDLVFQKMVAKAPEDRYQSMTEVMAALEGSRVAAPVGAGPFELQPGASSEFSSDSKLTAFLQGLPEVGVAVPAPRPHGETIQGQAELETGEELDKPGRSMQPAWMLPALIGGGVFLVVMIVGLVITRSRSGAEGPAEVSPIAQDTTRSDAVEKQESPTIDTQVEPEPAQPPETETAEEEPATDSAELVERTPETVPPAAEEMASDEPEEAPEEPPGAQPAPVSDINQKAEAARLAAMEAQRAAEAKYGQAIATVEAKVAEWDFLGAFEIIELIRFDEPDLAARLATRREEIRMMGALKQRIIAAINAADPPLEKSDLMIRGMGGQIGSAVEAGITATLRNDKTENSAWKDLGDRATGKLLELAIDPTNGKMLLAGALLALAAGETGEAEAYFDKAEAAGIDIAPYLVSVAAQSLSKATELLDEQQYADALEQLEHVETEYGSSDWFAANREAVAAVRTTAEKGVLDFEAELLYAEAVKLREADQLFDLRDLVVKLRSKYASSFVVGDATRSPKLVELEESVADLGRKLTVRLDGEGDFTSVQGAIDTAPARSLIEIQDGGTYYEKIIVPEEKDGIVIRGAGDNWPHIRSGGPIGAVSTLVTLGARGTELEHLIIGSSDPKEIDCVLTTADRCRLYKVAVFGGNYPKVGPQNRVESCLVGPAGNVLRVHTSTTVANSVFLNCGVGADARDVRLFNLAVVNGPVYSSNPITIEHCTITGPLELDSEDTVVRDCILGEVIGKVPGTTIEYSSITKRFVDLARPGKGCLTGDAGFVNPKAFDYRLRPNSPCIGMASDGGDIGCRFTPEMLQMYQLAFELRARGIIKF